MKYSKDDRVKKLLGLRSVCDNMVILLDSPSELGYKCPENRSHTIEWSEYNGMIWCYSCSYDWATPLCMPDPKRATEIFLDIIEDIKKHCKNLNR